MSLSAKNALNSITASNYIPSTLDPQRLRSRQHSMSSGRTMMTYACSERTCVCVFSAKVTTLIGRGQGGWERAGGRGG